MGVGLAPDAFEHKGLMIMEIWVLKRHCRAIEMIPLAVGANKARPYTANILMIFFLCGLVSRCINLLFQIGRVWKKC